VSAVVGLVEHVGGVPDRVSLESLSLAARLGGELNAPVHVVLFGDGSDAAVAALAGLGIEAAHVVEHPRLDAYAPVAWAAALGEIATSVGAVAVVAPGTERGTEVLAHLAARAALPMAANVVAVTTGDRWQVTRQRWAGSLLEEAWLDGEPRLVTVAVHALQPAAVTAGGPTPAVVRVTPTLTDADLRVRVTGRVETKSDKVSLTEARVVVGGGRGIGSAEGFAMLDELADLLGGAVGVSRVVTSAGWKPHAMQIGQTGLRIAPDLYIACGISGAIQHIVGCKSAKQILVINKDPDAPILGRAAYAVIGDVHTVVPAISAEIRRSR
jgi:electron transfer flavoprotein alpha subunit